MIMLMQVLGSTRLRSASSDEEWPYARDMPDEVPFHCYDDCACRMLKVELIAIVFWLQRARDMNPNVRRWYCTWKVTQRLAI